MCTVLESASIQEDYNNRGEMDPMGLSLNVPSPPLLGVDIDFGRKTTTKVHCLIWPIHVVIQNIFTGLKCFKAV